MSQIDKFENQMILHVPDEIADQLHTLFEIDDKNASDFIGGTLSSDLQT